MTYLIIILLVQSLLFGLLFSEKMKGKYVFILNGILFFILFGLTHFEVLHSAIDHDDFSFENEYFSMGFGLLYLVIWLVSFLIFNLLFPFLLSFVPIGLHKSIFYEKTNTKY